MHIAPDPRQPVPEGGEIEWLAAVWGAMTPAEQFAEYRRIRDQRDARWPEALTRSQRASLGQVARLAKADWMEMSTADDPHDEYEAMAEAVAVSLSSVLQRAEGPSSEPSADSRAQRQESSSVQEGGDEPGVLGAGCGVSPTPTPVDLFDVALAGANNAMPVLIAMLKTVGLKEGLMVADEIWANVKCALKVYREQRPEWERQSSPRSHPVTSASIEEAKRKAYEAGRKLRHMTTTPIEEHESNTVAFANSLDALITAVRADAQAGRATECQGDCVIRSVGCRPSCLGRASGTEAGTP